MKCPKCGEEDLCVLESGIDPLQEDGVDVSPEDTFIVLKYECSQCGVLEIFFDYDRTENKDKIIHQTPYEG